MTVVSFSRKAFTLMEIMIVIAIIGILAGVLYPAMTNYLERAHNSARITSTRAVIANITGKYELPLVAYFPFEEGSGVIINDQSSTNNNNAVFPANGLIWTGGHIGKSIQCNMNNGIVKNNESLNLTNNLTISIWLNPSSNYIGYAAHPIMKWGSTSDATVLLYYFGTTSGQDRDVVFYGNAGGVWKSLNSIGYKPPLNTWTMISLRFDAVNGSQLFVNGLPYGTVLTSPGILAINTSNLELCEQFPGSIDDLQIYNRTLTNQEILDIYTAGK